MFVMAFTAPIWGCAALIGAIGITIKLMRR